MKKCILMLVIAIAVTAAVSAQSYTVQEVTGRVQRVDGNARINVAVGDVISADTVIHTGARSSITLKSGDNSFTVPASKSGVVSELLAAPARGRARGNVARVETDAAVRTGGQATTASARASDAAQDDDIAAE